MSKFNYHTRSETIYKSLSWIIHNWTHTLPVLQAARHALLDPLELLHQLLPHPLLVLPPLLTQHILARLLDHTITDILPMTLRPQTSRVHQIPAPQLRAPREEELHNCQAPTSLARELAVAQTGVDAVDSHGNLGRALLLRHGADRQHLEELGHHVAVVDRARGLVAAERLEDLALGRLALLELGPGVDFGRGDGEVRAGVEFVRRLLELGQQREGEQEGGGDVDGDGGFLALGELPLPARDAGVEQSHVQARELLGSAGREVQHALVRGHVELPDLQHALLARAGFDVSFCFFAFGEGADGEDHGGGAEAGEVAGCFFPEADVGASHDYGFARVVVGWGGEGGEELGVDEAHGDGLLGGFGWWLIVGSSGLVDEC